MLASVLVALLASFPVRGTEGATRPDAVPATPRPSPADLETAWASALSAYRGGEYERSAGELAALVASIEAAPAGPATAGQWTRAMLRLAHAEATLGRTASARAAMERVATLDPDVQPDPATYPPSYRRAFEEARRAVTARPRQRLTIRSPEPGGTAWLHGWRVGPLPATVEVPAGRFRVQVTWSGAGAAEWVEVAGDPTREVTLAVAPPPSGSGGSPVPAAADLAPHSPPPGWAPPPPPAAAGTPPGLSADLRAPGSPGWMKPTAIATGSLALAGAGVAVWQGLAASRAQGDAQAMVRPDGSLVPGTNPDDYAAAVARYDSARTNALVAGSVAVAMTAASVVLWVLLDEPPAPGGPAIRF